MHIDLYGIAAVIGAVAALFTAFAAIMARKPVTETHAAVTATNGNPKPIGEIVADIAKATGSATAADGTPVPPTPPAPAP